METLITIALLLLLTAVSNWLQKRSQGNAGDSPPEGEESAVPPLRPERKPIGATPPSPAPPPQRPAAWDWAGELRRILDEGSGEPKAPAPRPIIDLPPQRQPAPVSTAKRPRAALPTQPAASKPRKSPPAVAVHPPVDTDILRTSQKAYQTASQLSNQVEEHLRQATEHKSVAPGPAPAAHRALQTSVELTAALILLRRPASARQAIIVSTVLGPPKAFED